MRVQLFAIVVLTFSFVSKAKAGPPYTDERITNCTEQMDEVIDSEKIGRIFNRFLMALSDRSVAVTNIPELIDELIAAENSTSSTPVEHVRGVTIEVPNKIAARLFYEGMHQFGLYIVKHSRSGLTQFYKGGGGKGVVAEVILILETLYKNRTDELDRQPERHLFVMPNKDGSLPGDNTYIKHDTTDDRTMQIQAAHVTLDTFMKENEVISEAIRSRKINVHYILGTDFMTSSIKNVKRIPGSPFKNAVTYFASRGRDVFAAGDSASFKNAVIIAEEQIKEIKIKTTTKVGLRIDGASIIGTRFKTNYASAFAALAINALGDGNENVVVIDKPTGIGADGCPVNWRIYPDGEEEAAKAFKCIAILEVFPHESNQKYKNLSKNGVNIHTADSASFRSAFTGFSFNTYLENTK